MKITMREIKRGELKSDTNLFNLLGYNLNTKWTKQEIAEMNAEYDRVERDYYTAIEERRNRRY